MPNNNEVQLAAPLWASLDKVCVLHLWVYLIKYLVIYDELLLLLLPLVMHFKTFLLLELLLGSDLLLLLLPLLLLINCLNYFLLALVLSHYTDQ
jgi:hypothetical protein